MNLAYSALLAVTNLRRSKLRTWLTVIGIVIGVASVVMIISLGTGLQENVNSQLGGLGADVVTMTAGASRAGAITFDRGGGGSFGGFGGSSGRNIAGQSQPNLTSRDIQTIKTASNVKAVTGIISFSGHVAYLGQNASVRIQGVDPLGWKDFATTATEKGRDLTPGDTNAVVLGSNIANNYFKNPLQVGAIVTIEGQPFRIVGILASSSGLGSGGDDNAVRMPITQARLLTDQYPLDHLATIYIKVGDTTLLENTTAELTSRLAVSRHVLNGKQDFTLSSTQALRNSISSVTSTLSLFLSAIAAISLLVGAIGIANTMFMAVLERTKQIGVLKAMGATRSEISRLFIIEAGILGAAGGIIGIALSLVLTILLNSLNIGLSLPMPGARGAGSGFDLSYQLIILAVIGAGVIGIIAGYVPARQAASLRPLEALRYE